MGFNLRLESLPILKNKFMVNDVVLLITVLTLNKSHNFFIHFEQAYWVMHLYLS